MAPITSSRGTNATAKPELTQERLKELLNYDPETGVFTRRTSTGGKHAGSVCGAPQNMGYIQIMIDKGNYLAHRLAWLYVHGAWPVFHVDHIDGCRTNNSFANLRDVERSTNAQNTHKPHFDNSTGFLGCSYDKSRNKYSSTIFINGHHKHLGRFPTPEEAHTAYVTAKRALHEGCTI